MMMEQTLKTHVISREGRESNGTHTELCNSTTLQVLSNALTQNLKCRNSDLFAVRGVVIEPPRVEFEILGRSLVSKK